MLKTNKKDFYRSFISLSIVDFISLLIPFITIPVLTRNISSDLYGEYLYFMSIVLFGITIVDYGINYIGVRDLAKKRDSKFKSIYLYNKHQALRWFMLLGYLVVVYLCLIISGSNNVFSYMLYSAVYLSGHILCSTWVFQALAKAERILVVTFITRISTLIVILFYIKSNDDVELLYLGTCIPMLISGLIQRYSVYKYFGKTSFSFGYAKTIHKSVTSGASVFMGILFPNLYSTLPLMYVGSVFSSSNYAILAVATKLLAIATMFQSVFFRSIFPILSRTSKNHVLSLITINIIFSLSVIIVVYIFGDYGIAWFLGPEYSAVSDYLKVIIFSLLFSSISSSIHQGYFLPRGLFKQFRNVNVLAAFIASISSFVLIYYYGLLGFAVGLSFSRLILSIFAVCQYYKEHKFA